MESEPRNISHSTNLSEPKNNIKIIGVIAIVVVLVVFIAFFASAFLSSPQDQDAWLFKGAYAKYEGSASVSAQDVGIFDMSLSIDFAVKLEVVDFNSTHALVSTSFQMSSSFGEFGGETMENEESEWVPLSEIGLMNTFEDVDLMNSYESTVNIDEFGTRNCIVYEYSLSGEGLTMKLYVDKVIEWPLKMTVSLTNTELSDGKLELDIKLVETNIPALK